MKIRMLLPYSLLVAGLMCATAIQTNAQAQGGGGRGGMGVITQEQRAKMRDTIQADLTPLMEKLTAAQKEAVKAALAKDATEASVKAKLEAVSKIQSEIAVLRFKAVKAIASELTEEQKTQLENARDGGYSALFGMMGAARAGRAGGGGGRNN